MENKSERIQAVASNEATEEAQAATIKETSYSGGSALLDAEITLEKEMDAAVDYPAATNITGDTNPDQAAIRTTGAYPASLEQLEDDEDISQYMARNSSATE